MSTFDKQLIFHLPIVVAEDDEMFINLQLQHSENNTQKVQMDQRMNKGRRAQSNVLI